MNYLFNNIKKVTNYRRFKCYDCNQKFNTYEQLVKHVGIYHKALVGKMDINQYLFDRRNPGDKLCVICKKNPRIWQPKKMNYSRYCDDPSCKQRAREAFRKNMKRVYGTDTLLTDPEHQAAMLANRSISGIFTWKTGETIPYTGKLELDFLEHCENELELGCTDITSCPPWTYTTYYDPVGKMERFYMPDFFLPTFKLVIEIKDGSKYPLDSKAKVKLKELAVIKRDDFNYIKIVEKDYVDFDILMRKLQENGCVERGNDGGYIVVIPKY